MSDDARLSPWGEFSRDPRQRDAAPLRASDRDRDVVLDVLGEAYADGRLTREEYDERVEVTSRSRTLGDLPPIVADLVPQTGQPALRPAEELAVEEYRRARRHALSGGVVTALLLTAIWAVTSRDGFFWPVFVMLAAGANILRLVLNKQDFVATQVRSIEEKRRAQLERPGGDH